MDKISKQCFTKRVHILHSLILAAVRNPAYGRQHSHKTDWTASTNFVLHRIPVNKDKMLRSSAAKDAYKIPKQYTVKNH